MLEGSPCPFTPGVTQRHRVAAQGESIEEMSPQKKGHPDRSAAGYRLRSIWPDRPRPAKSVQLSVGRGASAGGYAPCEVTPADESSRIAKEVRGAESVAPLDMDGMLIYARHGS
jgi:hypothetical protein